MSRSSARPSDLMAYSDETAPHHERAAAAIRELAEPLAALQASSGSYLRAAGLGSLVGELQALTGPAGELDAWVATIGAAFAEADSAALSAGGVAHVPDSTLAGLTSGPPTAGSAPGETGGPTFVIGEPTRPHFAWDADFPGEPDDNPSLADHASWRLWGARLQGGRHLRPHLDDAVTLYRHYRGNSGEPVRVDYEEGYREDSRIRQAVDSQVRSAQQHADELARSQGLGSFSITGDAVSAGSIVSAIAGEKIYATKTENWEKTLGGYEMWTGAHVEVDGDQATMTVTVNAEDRYNFNEKAADIKTGLKDNENVRFARLGWAQGFDVSGSVTRTVTWKLGELGDAPEITGSGAPERNAGREDREDGRSSGEQGTLSRPNFDRDMGPTRVR